MISISTPAGSSVAAIASITAFEGFKMSISLLCVRVSNCSRLSLYLCTARRMVITSFSVGSGTGPETVAPLLFRHFHNLLGRRVDQRVVIALQSDSDFFIDCHGLPPYSFFSIGAICSTLCRAFQAFPFRSRHLPCRRRRCVKTNPGQKTNCTARCKAYILLSPGSLSDILHENSPHSLRQPLASSHIKPFHYILNAA